MPAWSVTMPVAEVAGWLLISPRHNRAKPLLFLLLLGLLQPVGAEQDAREWLAKMERAARTLNYEGTFVYRHGDQMDSLYVVHRVDEAGEKERLVSLSGSGRAVLWDSSQVSCVFPDGGLLLGKRSGTKGMPPVAYSHEGFSRSYELAIAGIDRVAGRNTKVVNIRPRDDFRYGYRLWIDMDTGLLLKSELRDGTGAPLEQIMYTSVTLGDEQPDIETSTPARGGSEHPASAEKMTGRTDWDAKWQPVGFTKSGHERTLIPNSAIPVEHIVFVDGLASFSIYIEKMGEGIEYLEGATRMGAINAFGRRMDGYQVTVVGEVPRVTVDMVARSVFRKE